MGHICLVCLLFTSVKLPGAIWPNRGKCQIVHMWDLGIRLHTNNGMESNSEKLVQGLGDFLY